MSTQEVLQKEVLNVLDIQCLFNCGKGLAYKIIRQIKSVSDRLQLSGKVHRKDYEDYVNRPQKKNTVLFASDNSVQ